MGAWARERELWTVVGVREKRKTSVPTGPSLIAHGGEATVGSPRPDTACLLCNSADSPSQGPAHERGSPGVGLVAAPRQRLKLGAKGRPVREAVEGSVCLPCSVHCTLL